MVIISISTDEYQETTRILKDLSENLSPKDFAEDFLKALKDSNGKIIGSIEYIED